MSERIFKNIQGTKFYYLAQAIFVIVFLFIVACATTKPVQMFNYPVARKADVVDDYHGTKVADPYRWLEDSESKETLAWVNAQNKLTFDYVRTPAQEKLKNRLTELWNFPKYSTPFKEGGRYFFFKNDGLQNQSVFYMQPNLKTKPEIIIDPNKLSEDGTVAITGIAVANNGKLLAYLLSSSGSDWQELKIRNVDTGHDFEEIIKWCKFSSIAWNHDNSGFFYNRFPEPDTVPKEDLNNYNRVYWHKLGTPQTSDKLIFERSDNKELGFEPIITEDGKYLLLFVYHGTDPKNRIYYRETQSDKAFVRLLDKADAMYWPIGNMGTTFYFQTDLNAPKGKIISMDIRKPESKNWKEIVGEQKDVIHHVAMVNNHFVVAYMHHAHHQLKIYNLKGEFIKEINLPEIGSVANLSGKQAHKEMFFAFTSFLTPESIYRYDFTQGKAMLFQGPKINFDTSGYETKQVFYTSKDGTRVPMFITHKKGIELSGNNPTLLYGYGGFTISLTPSFSISRLVWLENGGVFALANLRGGNEYGEEWHQAGMLGNKQNVFDDFIGAAEWLIANKYTNSPHLAILGGSNGGLLVSACMVQRPALFGAVIAAVPVIDMLRYHKFSVGRYWVPEYGNAEKTPEHFKFLYAYSPLHNIKSGISYPPILVTTADSDDRVVPLHAKKFVATLQAADTGTNPILIRVETKAGHGGGKPTSKRIEEDSDIYNFLFRIFDMKIKADLN